MIIASSIATALVAILHTYFMILEMFLWTKPAGRKAFKLTQEQAESTKVLAANQGLYNGFIAAGLYWGIYLGVAGMQIKIFFLGCVLVAGIYGAATVSRNIFFIQGLPAVIALAMLLLG